MKITYLHCTYMYLTLCNNNSLFNAWYGISSSIFRLNNRVEFFTLYHKKVIQLYP